MSGIIEMAPYRFLKFNEDPGKWYPRPDAVGMAKLEEELKDIQI